VIFGADRGLCGGFTTGLMEELERFMGGAGRGPLQLVVMGKIAERRTRRAGHGIARAYRQAPVSYIAPGAGAEAGSPAGLAEVGRVAGFVTDGFLEGRYREVHLLYAEFISALRQPALVKPLLPLALPPHPSPRLRAALLEPDAERILARVAPEFVERSLYDAFINSLGSENAARQLAMSRATENAGELLEELVIGYRRMRQDGITAEMLELFGGEGAATE
jgi:F-type H+-transporting ATPase subunit gamma